MLLNGLLVCFSLSLTPLVLRGKLSIREFLKDVLKKGSIAHVVHKYLISSEQMKKSVRQRLARTWGAQLQRTT